MTKTNTRLYRPENIVSTYGFTRYVNDYIPIENYELEHECPREIDLTGHKYSKLTVLRKVGYKTTTNRKTRKVSSAVWECLCDCGQITTLRSGPITRGISKSCGCFSRKETASIHSFYTSKRVSAESRKIPFLLTEEQFGTIVKRKCAYCLKPPSTLHRNRSAWGTYNGVDRINSDLPYEYSNCVPCCTYCNYAKNDMTLEEFIDWIRRVYKVSVLEKNYAKQIRTLS